MGTAVSPSALMGSSSSTRRRSTLTPRGPEEVHEVLGRHRAEELALLGGLPALLAHQGLDPRTHALGLAADAVGLGVLLLPDVIEVLEVARGGGHGQPLGEEEVARVAIGHVAHLAASAHRR